MDLWEIGYDARSSLKARSVSQLTIKASLKARSGFQLTIKVIEAEFGFQLTIRVEANRDQLTARARVHQLARGIPPSSLWRRLQFRVIAFRLTSSAAAAPGDASLDR
ncbi:hypothetical protein ANN_18909 [Periplaneta americana]|uniref:Uncharacterized protein n=1 Tax=Periplaneta americana TaxID=6978 RepID=A0ABQ8SQT5_PERAM|nr:hypothetical protein ANN_18909 [Periplaneta americana]